MPNYSALGSWWEWDQPPGDMPAVAECVGLASKLISLKIKSVFFWGKGESPSKGACLRGIKETVVKAPGEERGCCCGCCECGDAGV